MKQPLVVVLVLAAIACFIAAAILGAVPAAARLNNIGLALGATAFAVDAFVPG